jgi:catechol 1,2-dioxygenase
MQRDPFDRRRFLKVSTTTVASLLIGCSDKGTVKHVDPMGSEGDQAFGAAPAPASGTAPTSSIDPAAPRSGGERPVDSGRPPSQCAATSGDITGPYWRKGIPIRHDFDVYGHSGDGLTLSGTVRDATCQPIPNAVIEMWHATPTVVTADALSPSDSVDYDMNSAAFRYYGQFATDQRGQYSMTTKKPGWYLNGDAFRPSHIHVKVYVAGVERLTTQLYFEGDPFIAQDAWASVAPERALKLTPERKEHFTSRFDFTLSKRS